MIRHVLVDTGPLVDVFAEATERSDRLASLCKEVRPPLLTCWPVVTEAAWLLRRHPSAVRALFEAEHAGWLSIEPLYRSDLPPIAALLERYADLRLQLADACLLHLAERVTATHVLTYDHRDFGAALTAAGRSLTILPGV